MSAANLFSEADLSRVIQAHGEKLDRAAAALDPDKVGDEQFSQTTAALAAEYAIEPLEIDESSISTSTKETEVDISRDPNRLITDRSRPFLMKGTKVTFFVPFSGESGLWNCRPSSFTQNPPRGQVQGNELLLQYEGVDLEPDHVRAQLEQELAKIRQYLGWLTADIDAFNSTVRARVERQVVTRRAKVDRDRGLADGLGFRKRQEAGAEAAAVIVLPTPAKHSTPEGATPAGQRRQPLDVLISRGEGPSAEFKSTLRWDIRENKINRALQDEVLQAVAAFLNSRGGTLLIGVGPDQTVPGLLPDLATFRKRDADPEDQFLQTIANLVADGLGAAFTRLVRAELEPFGSVAVCRVTIQAAPGPCFIGPDLFIRVGNTSRKLSARDAVEYVRTHWR